MAITVKFFASLRERVGQAETAIVVTQNLRVSDIWLQTTRIAMPANTLCAVNMEYVDYNHVVQDGDEVAFFPPVTGG